MAVPKRSHRVLSAIILSVISGHATAQQPATGGAARTVLEEVVVTARKKGVAELAQDVPVTLTAVSGTQIEAMFAKNLSDVGLSMPNVRLDTAGAFPGAANYTVRGMGFNSTIASVEPTVGVFVDGMYIGANLGGAPDTFDLESVEVLRGPQGTLFGRNVTAGAVVMRSRRPTGEFGGVFRTGLGSGERKMIAVGVEGSLTETLAGKVYTQYSDRDGDWDNLTLDKDHGAEKIKFVRPILRWRPTAGVDLSLIGEYGELDGDGVASRILNDPASGLFRQGVREPRGGAEKLSINYTGYTDIEWQQVVLDASWEIGGGTIASITGYRDVDYEASGDTDGSEREVARALNAMTQHQFSEELRYAGKVFDDRLDYTVGIYYFEQDVEQFYHVRFQGTSIQRSRGIVDHRTWSVFAQGDWQFVPNIFFTAGGRYTWEKKEAEIARTPECTIDLVCTLTDVGDTTWKNFSPKLGLSWRATEDVLLYASWTKGFRSGGYNIRTTGVNESPGPYDEEVVKALEAGVKSDLLGGRARINAAVFHNKYSDLQRTVNQGLVNFIANVAKASVDGAELETTVLPLDSLALTVNVGYLDATYDSYPTLDVNGDGTPDPELAKGLRLVRAPKWSYTFAATHDLSLGGAGQLSTRVSFTHNGRTTMNDANTYFVPEFDLLDASVTWSPAANDHLKVSIWGKNLTNETYALTGTVTGFFTNLYQSLPRHYGVEVSYRF
jgi:outer membrane receptor protein involved in Fe transport